MTSDTFTILPLVRLIKIALLLIAMFCRFVLVVLVTDRCSLYHNVNDLVRNFKVFFYLNANKNNFNNKHMNGACAEMTTTQITVSILQVVLLLVLTPVEERCALILCMLRVCNSSHKFVFYFFLIVLRQKYK